MPKEDYALVIEMVSTWGKKLSEAVEDAVRNGSFTAEELERIKHLKETNDRLSNNFENIFDDNQVYFYDDDLVASREDILIWAYISNLSNFISLFTICASKKEYNVNFSDDLLKNFLY